MSPLRQAQGWLYGKGDGYMERGGTATGIGVEIEPQLLEAFRQDKPQDAEREIKMQQARPSSVGVAVPAGRPRIRADVYQ